MVICGGLSTVPLADVEPGRVGEPVGAPTQDHSRTGEANVGMAAGKGQHSDLKENKGARDETTVDASKVSHEHIPPDTYRIDHPREI